MRATTSAVTYRKTPYDPISILLTTTSHAKRAEEGGSRDGSREVMGCVGGGVARWTWERSAGVIPWIDHQYRNSPNGRGCGCGGGLGAHWRHSTRKERRGGAPFFLWLRGLSLTRNVGQIPLGGVSDIESCPCQRDATLRLISVECHQRHSRGLKCS
jgi:hypothetical protein